MTDVALGSSWSCWKCSWRSNPLTPWVTQDLCRAHMYNANPVWQASQASPIDFSSATQPLSSPKQLHSDKCWRRGALHMDSPDRHQQCQELGCLNNRSLCGRERKGALYLLSKAMPPSLSLCEREWGERSSEWRQASNQKQTYPAPRHWQIRLLTQASASELSYSAGGCTQMSRADSPEQGRGKIACRQLSFTRALWPAGVDIYARVWACSGSNWPRIETKANNHSPRCYFREGHMHIWKGGGGNRRRQERSPYLGYIFFFWPQMQRIELIIIFSSWHTQHWSMQGPLSFFI